MSEERDPDCSCYTAEDAGLDDVVAANAVVHLDPRCLVHGLLPYRTGSEQS